PRMTRIAIPAAVAILIAIVVAPRVFRFEDQKQFLVREVVAAHVRSTLAAHLIDVASSDRHTVKPWFQGKLDYSPPVQDFAGEGFQLAGGRVDYLDDRPVAGLVYRHGAHVINVFIWPASEPGGAPMTISRNGYEVEHFVHAGMNFWIVSDTTADEIHKLANLLGG